MPTYPQNRQYKVHSQQIWNERTNICMTDATGLCLRTFSSMADPTCPINKIVSFRCGGFVYNRQGLKPLKCVITCVRVIFLLIWLSILPTSGRWKNTDLWNFIFPAPQVLWGFCLGHSKIKIYNVIILIFDQQKKMKAFGASCILEVTFLGHGDYMIGSDWLSLILNLVMLTSNWFAYALKESTHFLMC